MNRSFTVLNCIPVLLSGVAVAEEPISSTDNPAIETRIAQYEMAFRMQSSIPEVKDISDESEETLKMYGDEVRTPRYLCIELPAREATCRAGRAIHSALSTELGPPRESAQRNPASM